MTQTARHKWGEPSRTSRRTDRVCSRCALVKVTRHESGQHPWQEFERDGFLVNAGGRVPPCEAAFEPVRGKSMLVRVLDCETTDMPPEADLVEIGCCDVEDGVVIEETSCSILVKPTRPISLEARAAHHITDAELVGACSADEAIRRLLWDKPDVLCAHTAAFEQHFIASDLPWICTLKVGRRLWPESPSHSNQVLRYFLGLDLDPPLAMPPHRAGPDAFVTANILAEAWKRATIAEMIAITLAPSLLPQVNFGKYKGKGWKDLPVDYLDWLVKQGKEFDEDTIYTARCELKRRASLGEFGHGRA